MSLIDFDTWSSDFENCNNLTRKIQLEIADRNREHNRSEAYTRASAAIRVNLKRLASELETINRNHEQSARSGILTLDEAERRHRQIEILQSKRIKLEVQFKENPNTQGRTKLFQSESLWDSDNSETDVHGQASSSNDVNEFAQQNLKQQQEKILEDQNTGIEALSNVIARQKHLALRINDEVEIQNDLIDNLADEMENTDIRVAQTTRHVVVVNQKDSTCRYWIIILVLLIANCILIIL